MCSWITRADGCMPGRIYTYILATHALSLHARNWAAHTLKGPAYVCVEGGRTQPHAAGASAGPPDASAGGLTSARCRRRAKTVWQPRHAKAASEGVGVRADAPDAATTGRPRGVARSRHINSSNSDSGGGSGKWALGRSRRHELAIIATRPASPHLLRTPQCRD